eukprot:5660537-Amphidinium_carterae.2
MSKTRLSARQVLGVGVQKRCTARCGGVPWWRSSRRCSGCYARSSTGLMGKVLVPPCDEAAVHDKVDHRSIFPSSSSGACVVAAHKHIQHGDVFVQHGDVCAHARTFQFSKTRTVSTASHWQQSRAEIVTSSSSGSLLMVGKMVR